MAVSTRTLQSLGSRLGALAHAWLPTSCIVCGGNEASGLCSACERELPGAAHARCIRCGIAMADVATPPQAECHACRAAPVAFTRTVVLADYAPPLDRVVHALKFGRDASLAAPLGRCLARRACEAIGSLREQAAAPIVVTAIPLTTRRLAGRGFNQSLEIARAFARQGSLALDHRLLIRVRESAPASTLHAQQRRQALHGAFEARRPLDGRIVIVVDDVMTTGATLEAAAQALVCAGAAFVVNCVVARTRAR